MKASTIISIGLLALIMFLNFRIVELNNELSDLREMKEEYESIEELRQANYELVLEANKKYNERRKEELDQLPKDIQDIQDIDELKLKYDLLQRHISWLEEILIDRIVGITQDNELSLSSKTTLTWVTYILKGSNILLEEKRNLNNFPSSVEICTKLKEQYPMASCYESAFD